MGYNDCGNYEIPFHRKSVCLNISLHNTNVENVFHKDKIPYIPYIFLNLKDDLLRLDGEILLGQLTGYLFSHNKI